MGQRKVERDFPDFCGATAGWSSRMLWAWPPAGWGQGVNLKNPKTRHRKMQRGKEEEGKYNKRHKRGGVG